MSELIEVAVGSAPWMPSPSAKVIEVVHEYDRPLLVVLEQAGTQYMARCVLGELGDKNVWIYVRIDPQLDSVLLCEGTPEQIDQTADEALSGPAVIALASDDRISYSAPVEADGDLEFFDRVVGMLDQMQDSLTRLASETQDMSRVAVKRN